MRTHQFVTFEKKELEKRSITNLIDEYTSTCWSINRHIANQDGEICILVFSKELKYADDRLPIVCAKLDVATDCLYAIKNNWTFKIDIEKIIGECLTSINNIDKGAKNGNK